jgi:nucleoside-diphosphate-sugar epimerase
MRLLVLGGTAWLGLCIATAAVERGHHVTCLARGESGAAPPGAAFTRADRDGTGAYREVAREEWDVVIDVCRQPGQVARATTALAAEQAHSSMSLPPTSTPATRHRELARTLPSCRRWRVM